MSFQKQKTKTIAYRKFKTFDNKEIRLGVLKHNFDKNDFGSYKNTAFNLFNEHVPLKKKNEAPCTTKHLKKL